jgi:UDP-glucuronate 4-epimerase
MNILVIGYAGFIGHHLCNRLLEIGYDVIGIDNLSADLSGKRYYISKVKRIYKLQPCDLIIHLAAKPGVLLSQLQPELYMDNINYFFEVMQFAKQNNIKLIYASSSSADNPQSFYGLTKLVNEQTAKLLYPSVGLRFYSVYGEWGGSDMSYWKFTKNILEEKPIQIWGDYARDFTYVSDIVDGIIKSIDLPAGVYEVGSGNPQTVEYMIELIEYYTGKMAIKEYKDVPDKEKTHSLNSIIKPQI